MIWPQFQTVAQLAITRVLNSLPEGLLIAGFAWIAMRLLPRQNSSTRFAVWFVALLAVAGMPFIGGSGSTNSFATTGEGHPVIHLPGGWGVILFSGWILVAAVALLRVGAGLWHVRTLRHSCVPIDLTSIDGALAKTVAEFSATRSVTVGTSELVNVPAAVGFVRPVIVIPAWALRELPADDLNTILLHEFAHLRRWDDWTNLLQKVVRAVFVLNPAVWWIENRLSLEREMACDDLVLAETGNPRGYAKCLIALLEKSFARRGLAMAQAAVHRAREASLRLAQILDAGRPKTKKVWKPALAGVGVFCAICVGVAAHAPQFVSFEPSSPRVHSDAVNANALDGPALPAAAVIPAALHTSSFSSVDNMFPSRVNKPRGVVVKRAIVHPNAPAHADPALIAKAEIPAQVQPTKAEAGPNLLQLTDLQPTSLRPADIHPTDLRPTDQPTETLVMIRTTEQTGPNSWTWSVYVWRVVWTNAVQNKIEKAPIAHKT
jgi:hypothetical protein